MSWQDIVLTLGTWLFNISLLPSVFGKDKPSFWTSVLTVILLIPFGAVYASYQLWYTVIATGVGIILWSTLAVQKLKQKAEIK